MKFLARSRTNGSGSLGQLPGLLVCGLALCLAARPLDAAPVVQFSSPDVIVSQVTPGGEVAVFYVGHETSGDLVRRSYEVDQLTDADGDGSITVSQGGGLAERSIWSVVDLASGAVTVQSPAGFAATQVTPDLASLTAVNGAILDARQSLHLVLVRPSLGVLYGSSFDGAASDAGAADDGQVELELSSLQLANGGFTPRIELQSGDILVGIDPEFLTYYTLNIP